MRWIATAGIGLAAALAYFHHFIQRRISRSLDQTILLIYLTILFTLLAYFLLFRFTLPRLRRFSQRAKIAWALIPFVAAAGLIVVIPIERIPPPIFHSLEIVATGQKIPIAQGSEVWVNGLYHADGSQISFSDVIFDGAWEMRNGVALSHQNQPSTLRWQGTLDDDIQIRFGTHPWSGIAEIRWANRVQTVNLFSDAANEKVITLPYQDQATADSKIGLFDVLLFSVDVIGLGLLIFVASVWLATRPVHMTATQTDRWTWVWTPIPCIGVWCLYLVAFWPGLMTSDSLDQWRQIVRGQYHNDHPAFHTLTNWLITRIWFSPAAVALTQIVVMALVFGLATQELSSWKVPLWARLLLMIVFSISIVNGTMIITLWKDIPYTIATLGVFTILLRLVRTQGKWVQSRAGMVLFWLSVSCVALYRHNGFVVATLLVLVLLWLWRRTYFIHILIVGIAVLVTFFVVTGPIYRIIGVVPTTPIVTFQTALHQTGAIIHNNIPLSQDEEYFLTAIQPIESWQKNYYCHSVISLFDNKDFDSEFFNANAGTFIKTWFNLAIKHPGILLRHQICASALVWRVTPPSDSYFYSYVFPISTNDLGLASEPKWPFMIDVLNQLGQLSLQTENVWWVWRPALYLYLTIFCLSIAALRLRRPALLIVGLPSLFNALTMLALIPAPDFRFQYPVYVIGLIAPALLFAGRPCEWASPHVETDRSPAAARNQ